MEGLIAAVYTPLTDGGELNLEIVQSYAEFLVSTGVRGAFINGSTGDFTSLSTQERKIIVDEWSRHKADDFLIMSQVGHTSLKDSIDLAQHSAKAKVDAIASVAPYYYKPANIETLIHICSRTAESVPEIPFYFYHIPSLTGVDFNMVEFLQMASESIPNFQGIKYSKQDLMDFKFCKEFNNRSYDILFGMDELMVCGLSLGARGMVGTTYNHIPKLYHQIIQAFEEGRTAEASELQFKSMSFINTLASYGFTGAGKACMRLNGLDCGPVRLPHANLSSEDYVRLLQELKNLDLLQYFSEEASVMR